MIVQRNPRSPYIKSVRPLTREDLVHLRGPSARARLQTLRSRHHKMAMMIASGAKITDVAAACNMSPQRVSILSVDPSVKDLIAQYQGDVVADIRDAMKDYAELVARNSLTAEVMLASKLESLNENEESLPVRDLLAISRDGADRFGYGKKSTVTNINVDFAKNLEAAIARSRQTKYIDAAE